MELIDRCLVPLTLVLALTIYAIGSAGGSIAKQSLSCRGRAAHARRSRC